MPKREPDEVEDAGLTNFFYLSNNILNFYEFLQFLLKCILKCDGS